MQLWADYLDKLREGAQVIEFGKHACQIQAALFPHVIDDPIFPKKRFRELLVCVTSE